MNSFELKTLPEWVVIYQNGSGIEGMVEMPLLNIGLVRDRHYIVSHDPRVIADSLSAGTRLLVLGTHSGGLTTGLDGLIQRAKALNPNVVVVGYSICPMEGLPLDKIIVKSGPTAALRLASSVLAALI